MTTNVLPELQNYTLVNEIGRGDLTVVYQGRRETDGANVAIKVVPPQFTFDEYFARRFLDMSKQAVKLEHPNIVRTYEAQQENDTLFVVREFIEARTLTQVLEVEGPFSPRRMLNIAKQIANALDYAHQKSIMHGDLSTNRIYLGQEDHVIVADFGQVQAITGTSLVKQGFAVGTPEIMAPERVHGQGPSRQSDLYSLGILCYQMLNIDPPFVGSPAAVLHAQAYEQPKPLHIANPGVSLRLSEAIGRMLSKGLELRYTTGSEFSRALSVAIEGTSPVRITSKTSDQFATVAGPPTPLWRRPWVWAILAIPLIIVLLGSGFLLVSLWLAMLPLPEPTATAIVQQVAPVVSQPTTSPDQPDPVTSQPAALATIAPLEPQTLIPTATVLPTDTPTLTPTPTLVPLPTPGPPTIAAGSPFTNLQLAHEIAAGDQPQKVGTSFAPGAQPIYLFFDYSNIAGGTNYTHRWTWGDTELGVFEDVWPENYSPTGTAWVYYSPTGGFEPGPYQVTIELAGQIVATATFVVQPGGL